MENPIQNSQTTITAADVWKLFEENAARQKETDRELKETGLLINELRESHKETGRLINELRESHKETEALFKDYVQQRNIHDRKADARIAYLDNLFSVQWGKLMEALARPSALKLFQERGIKIDHIYYEGEKGQDLEHKIEVDCILCNHEEVVVVEVKTTCRVRDIDYFLQQMEHFKSNFREFENRKVYVAVAAIKYTESSDVYARSKGLYVLRANGNGIFGIEDPVSRKEY